MRDRGRGTFCTIIDPGSQPGLGKCTYPGSETFCSPEVGGRKEEEDRSSRSSDMARARECGFMHKGENHS